MRYKTHSRKGYTISELLMTVLVLSMVVVMLGGGIVVVKNAYEKTNRKAEAQTLLSTTIIKVTDELRYAENIGVVSSGGATPTDIPAFDSGISGYRLYLESKADGKIYRHDTVSDRTEQILTDKTMTNELTHSISYSYTAQTSGGAGGAAQGQDGFFTATIRVLKGDEVCAEQDIRVRPLNQ